MITSFIIHYLSRQAHDWVERFGPRGGFNPREAAAFGKYLPTSHYQSVLDECIGEYAPSDAETLDELPGLQRSQIVSLRAIQKHAPHACLDKSF
jgi:hypothetical protein